MDIAAVDREVALAGMFMVLFLTANGIAQSVRERFAEFATLKTIGFSDNGVIALVFAEAAIPCLLGAGLGIGLAAVISNVMPHFLPPGQGLPIPDHDADGVRLGRRSAPRWWRLPAPPCRRCG